MRGIPVLSSNRGALGERNCDAIGYLYDETLDVETIFRAISHIYGDLKGLYLRVDTLKEWEGSGVSTLDHMKNFYERAYSKLVNKTSVV
jgi:hypothetical protein